MELLLILIAAGGLRALSLLSPSSDEVIHLWNVRFRRQHGNFRSQVLTDGVFEGRRGYPTLSHGIISLFPQRIWKPAGLGLNVFWDLVVIAVSWWFLSRIEGPGIAGFSFATCAGLLIATCPLLIPVNPRMRSLGARTFGGMLCFGYFLAMGYGLLVHPLWGGLVCVVFGLLIVGGSQFGIQVMVFVSLTIAAVFPHWLPVAVLAAVGIVAWCVPWLGLRDVLRFRKAHMAWYFRNQQKEGTAPATRNRLKDHLRFPVDLALHPRKALLLVYYHSSILGLLVTLPMLSVGVILWGMRDFSATLLDDPVRQYAAMVVLGTAVAFVLTSLPRLMFLGEAERYFEYSVPFLAMLFVYLAGTSSNAAAWFWGMLGAQMFLCLVQLMISRRDARGAGRHGEPVRYREELRQFITAAPPHRILTLPVKDSYEISTWSDGRHRFYYRFIMLPRDTKRFAYMDEDCATLSYPRTDLEHFRERYDVDWVVFDKTWLAKAESEGFSYPLERYPAVWENDGFLIVSLFPLDHSSTDEE
ncbi:MAG: hypothetical protein JXA11_13415 [Phycisphaerae bacterium]|nr:hypothetical protein [Phycisphaerae bacterium]